MTLFEGRSRCQTKSSQVPPFHRSTNFTLSAMSQGHNFHNFTRSTFPQMSQFQPLNPLKTHKHQKSSQSSQSSKLPKFPTPKPRNQKRRGGRGGGDTPYLFVRVDRARVCDGPHRPQDAVVHCAIHRIGRRRPQVHVQAAAGWTTMVMTATAMVTA